jgi:hypothetical protein
MEVEGTHGDALKESGWRGSSENNQGQWQQKPSEIEEENRDTMLRQKATLIARDASSEAKQNGFLSY